MTSPYAPREVQPAYPRLFRPQDGRVVAGVAAGLAGHLGVDVLFVRLAFTALCALGGLGAFLYAGVWVATKPADAPVPTSRFDFRANWLLVIAAVVAVGLGMSAGGLLIPLVIVGAGALITWQAYDRGLGSVTNKVSVGAGGVLVLAGVVVTVARWNGGTDFGPALAAVLLTVVGFGALVVPLVLKLWRQVADEGAEKAASEARADMAAQLHDSVLQTLALIQKRAEDPEEVARLARGQERELRAGRCVSPSAEPATVFGALAVACGEVEDLFPVRIAPVTVGEDVELTEATKLAVQAAREAMVNAGKHAGVDTVDVYAENLAGELAIFVRDRGAGFDMDAVAEDRHGIRDSVCARMEAAGGTARVNSRPGEGTEVELTVAL